MLNAVIYARFSSSAQREESIDTQVRECREYAEKHDLNVVQVYTDKAKSGRVANRPAFQRMIKDSDSKKWDVLLLYTLDRFARNRFDAAIYRRKLKDNGVKVIYVRQNLGEGKEYILLESMLDGYAEYYSVSLSESVRAGMKENALHAKSNGGTVPYGYKIGPDKSFIIDEEQAKGVKKIFEMYSQDYDCQQIADWLNSHGFVNAIGNPFNKKSFTVILKNERYLGIYKHGDTRIPGGMPQIIDSITFNKVQEKLQEVGRSRARYKAKEIYLLTPKVFCAHCGAPMYGESGTGRSGEVYTYYKCSTRKKGGNCTKRSEKKRNLERFVLNLVNDELLTEEMIEYIADRVDLYLKEKDPEELQLRKRIADITQDLNNSYKAITKGMDSPEFFAKVKELEEAKRILEEELADVMIVKKPLTREAVVYYLSAYKEQLVKAAELDKYVSTWIIQEIHLRDTDTGTEVTVICNAADPTKVDPEGQECSNTDALVHQSIQNPNRVLVEPHRFQFGYSTFYTTAPS